MKEGGYRGGGRGRKMMLVGVVRGEKRRGGRGGGEKQIKSSVEAGGDAGKRS